MNVTHPELVAALAKPGADIVATLTAEDAPSLHMAVGIAGEAGELLDALCLFALHAHAHPGVGVDNIRIRDGGFGITCQTERGA